MKGLKKPLLVVLSFLSSAAFIAVAVRHLRLPDIARAYADVEPWPWVPLAVLLYLTGHLVRGVRCRLFVSRDVAVGLVGATNVVVLGYAVNNILPARLGEFARAGMLSRLCGLPFTQCLTITFVERVFDGLALLVLLLIGAGFFPHATWLTATVRIGAVVFGIASLGIAVAMLAPSFLLAVTSRIAQRFGARVHGRAVGLVSQVIAGVSYVREGRAAFGIAVSSIVVWLLEASMFLALLPAFDLAARPAVATVTMTVTNFGILVPSSPGFVGSFHFFCMRALTLAGVPEAVAFSYAVLAHLSFFIPITLWGIAILVGYGVRLGSIAVEAAEARPLEIEATRLSQNPVALRPRDPRPDPTLAAITEALLPFDDEALPDSSRPAVVEAVATFVTVQTRSLPGHLAWMFVVGLFGFHAITWLVHFRSIRAIPIAKRRRWVEAWAYGRLWVTRQLFRALRSTALIAYYEDPLVRAHLRSPDKVALRQVHAG